MATGKGMTFENSLSYYGSANRLPPFLGAPARVTYIPKPDQGHSISKMNIRIATWSKLDTSEMVLFPRPCKYRIPRFKGENEAVERLAQLDIFKTAKVIKVNLDKTHERLRLEVLQCGKRFIVATPGLREAVFLLVRPPAEPSMKDVSRSGIHYLGTALDFSRTKADLVIVGCVAVDKQGRMIGKGRGFSDLEYALLSKFRAIAPNAVVVTLVHDLQVYDEFPEELFKKHDLPVDVIITPTQLIEVSKRLPKPTLYWNILSRQRVNDIAILGFLYDSMKKAGIKVDLLNEIDADLLTGTCSLPQIPRKRFMGRPRQPSSIGQYQQGRIDRRGEASGPHPNLKPITYRRSPTRAIWHGPEQIESQQKNMKPVSRGPRRRISHTKNSIEFSLCVSGLTSSVRIRDLKAALIERGVRPVDITWIPTKGVAILHFGKRTDHDIGNAGVNEILARLQYVSVQSEDGTSADLSFEIATPIIATPTDNVDTWPKIPKVFLCREV